MDNGAATERPVRVMAWEPDTGRHVQFLDVRHAGRWLSDLDERGVALTAVRVWYVDDDDRAIRRVRPCKTATGGGWVLEDGATFSLVVDGEGFTGRQRQIATALEQALMAGLDEGTDVRAVSLAEWANVPPSLWVPWVQFGYAPVGMTGLGEVRFCPELIDAQTDDLDDDDLDMYLVGIELRMLIEWSIRSAQTLFDAASIAEAVDATVANNVPESVMVMAQVAGRAGTGW